tara:strand:- start:59 stop:709 length:651 start_codon:yes stop_codon:yes gene_type:complete
MSKYILVNPWIHGKIKPTVSSDNSIDAANKLYGRVSKLFNNNIPEFFFTIQKVNKAKDISKGKASDYSHFKVTEKRGSKNKKAIKFNLEEITLNKSDNKNLPVFKKELYNTILEIKNGSKKNMEGGDLFDDDDDLLDDDLLDDFDDDERFYRDIYRYDRYKRYSDYYGWYYSPYLYTNSIYRSLYVPTFALNARPYIQLTFTVDQAKNKFKLPASP